MSFTPLHIIGYAARVGVYSLGFGQSFLEHGGLQMLSRSLCTLGVVCCLAVVVRGAEFEFSYRTINDLGPLELRDGETTAVEISVVNNGVSTLFIGGLTFDFANPDGGLSWDLLGPDGFGADPTNGIASADDGFVWQVWLDGNAFLFPPGTPPPYSATVDPPQTAFVGSTDALAFPIAAGDSFSVATLFVTADLGDPGPAVREATLNVGTVPGVLVQGVGAGFAVPTDLGGSESVVFTIVPEPATLVLSMVGGLASLRRRRSARVRIPR